MTKLNYSFFVITKRCFSNSKLSKDNPILNNKDDLKQKTISKSDVLKKLAKVQSNIDLDSFSLCKNNEDLKVMDQDVLLYEKMYPSVTNILSTTMSSQSLAMLDKWKRTKIEELGEKGFRDYQQNVFNRGKLLHQNVKLILEGSDPSKVVISENIEKLCTSLQPVLPLFNNVKLCEAPICHPILCYKGIVDCVAFYQDKLVVIEWKTSERLKPTLRDVYDNPLQAVAYQGAINYSDKHSFQINEIVLVYSYENGSKAQVHYLDKSLCEEYWKKWLERLKEFWKNV